MRDMTSERFAELKISTIRGIKAEKLKTETLKLMEEKIVDCRSRIEDVERRTSSTIRDLRSTICYPSELRPEARSHGLRPEARSHVRGHSHVNCH